MRTEALRIEHIGKKAGEESVLSDINLSLFSGAFHAVLMQSSSGRSALVDILDGAAERDGGNMYLFDAPYRVSSPFQAKKEGVFCIRYYSRLVPGLSIAENLFLTDKRYERCGFVRDKRQNAAAAELLAFGRLKHLSPGQLAGSLPIHEAHMIEILRAVSQNARVLIFENVTERYSDMEIHLLLRFLSIIKERGLCVVFFSSKYNVAFDVADYASIIRHGRTIAHYSKGAISRSSLLRHFNAPSAQRGEQKEKGRKVLELRDVAVGDLRKPVHCSVCEGEVVGIWDQEFLYSPALVNILFGKKSYKGEILLDGQPLKAHSYKTALRQGLILVPEKEQANYAFFNMGLEENLTLMMRAPLYRWGIRSESVQRFASRHALSSLGFEALYDRLAGKRALPPLRRREQMQILVAKWLTCHPKAFIFVNPFFCYDDLTVHELRKMFACLCREGLGVMIFSMNLRELKEVSDRIYRFQDALEELV